MSDDRLNTYLDKLDDDSTGYTDDDIVALASMNPRGAWSRRETLNVVSREIQAEYVIWRESAIEDVEIAQTGAQREIGTKLVLRTDSGYQLIVVDTRANGKVWVYGYDETEGRLFYQSLAETDEITPAPQWAVFGADVDMQAVKLMRDEQTHPEADTEFYRRKYRGMGE